MSNHDPELLKKYRQLHAKSELHEAASALGLTTADIQADAKAAAMVAHLEKGINKLQRRIAALKTANPRVFSTE